MVEGMKGDVLFAGFVLTAEEWQQLDPVSRAQLIAVATRRADPWLVPPPRPSKPHEVELIELEPDPE